MLLTALFVCVAAAWLGAVAYTVVTMTPDESCDCRAETARLARRMPSASSTIAAPRSRWVRLRHRWGRCRREGHAPVVAFQAGRYRQQCRHCGRVERHEVVTGQWRGLYS